jgi:signal transduction histidine kinase
MRADPGKTLPGNVQITVRSDCEVDLGGASAENPEVYNDSMECHQERRFSFNDEDFNLSLDSGNGQVIMFSRVENLFRRIVGELDAGFGTMDSTRIAGLLNEEFKAMGLESPIAWCVFDHHENKRIIQPAKEMDWEFVIPLEKNAVLHPNRYQMMLYVSKSELLWADMRGMIVLSMVFLLVVMFAFAYSIRLVIKHKKISQIKSDFINNMTHEFKTPLASISLAADSIMHPRVMGQWDAVEKYVDIIKAEKTKLNDQVERILEVASLEKDALEIPTVQVSINDIVKSSASKLGMLLEERNARLRINENAEATIEGNEFYLERVITNIIENSIKYSKDHPDILINIRKLADKVEIEIADKGIGMTRQQIDKVFDNFYRVQTGNVHNTKGFGLGLSYAKLITEKLHGTIVMEGQLNVGCTVKLQFPLAA